MDIICEIEKKYNDFSDKEKKIADYIIKYGDELRNINITDLAKNIGTSGATITRFARKIGCETFVDMKIKLNTNKSENNNIPNDEEDVFTYVYKYYSKVIEKTNQLVDKKLINEVVSNILEAKTIYIYGVSSSGLTATEMMQRFLRMGFNVHSISDSHMMIINSSIVSKEDLVIGLSVSGETKEVVEALRIAKENGAKTVSLTSFEKSSITNYSDLVLMVSNSSFIDKHKFINSQFSAIYILDMISMVLLQNKELSNNMQKTIKAILGE